MPDANTIQAALRALANQDAAAQAHRYFKAAEGQYGAGDLFLGIRVPVVRQQVKLFKATPLAELSILLASPFHEERLCALLILVYQFEKAQDQQQRDTIYDLYMANRVHINNWDLVDTSAPFIVGGYLIGKTRKPLYKLAKSKLLWDRRIAIMATFRFIRAKDYADALALAELLLQDKEDLIHKAVGWMLREIGNRAPAVEREFLKQHHSVMPRTMLRYAIEKFPEKERQRYLSGKVR